MSVMLSAASCLDWAAKLTGRKNVPTLIAAARLADETPIPSGFCRTCPASARRTIIRRQKGVFFGLTHPAWPGGTGAGGGRRGICSGGWHGCGSRLRRPNPPA
ncbi:hypothetical protein KCP75_19415 [Salmonella enterica subsp. enterica]|nr:hypothetical protein KCP75_19415 [Salmonella enterica subsp. enterica]